MARTTSSTGRLKFFSLGNTHCPICLVPFAEDDVRSGRGVTLEHAPPKTLGGKVVCLTCEPCNSRASATSDQAVRKSKSPPDVVIETSGIKRTARFWPEGIPPSRMPYGFSDGPAAKKAQRELAKETIVAVTQPIQFDRPTTIRTISMVPKSPNARHVESSYLRSAYLWVFSLLGRSGYVFAQSEGVSLIRAQILNPNDEIATSLLQTFAQQGSPGNKITLRNKQRPYFWSVKFDDGMCVFLPHGGSENHYREIAELPAEQRVRGWEWGPPKFGNMHVDRRRLLRQSNPHEDGLFGREYVTVSNDGREQRWVVVNETGDAMRAGPETRPNKEASGMRVAQQSSR